MSAAWEERDSTIALHVVAQAGRMLGAYAAQPKLVEEHVEIEQSIKSGGYGRRQVHELIQNAADAIQEAGGTGRVHVLLTERSLYCANEGAPIDIGGVSAILLSHISRKQGAQIGHFGLGFKSVLGVTSRPEFYSRSGSFGFDPETSGARIRAAAQTRGPTPILRIAEPLSPIAAARHDAVLAELMSWATTIVRLPRDYPTEWLADELSGFKSQFLLFSPHVAELVLEDRGRHWTRRLTAKTRKGVVHVSDDGEPSRWRVLQARLKTDELKAEAREDADPRVLGREELPLIWAVPLDPGRERGRFWAFFPTETETTLSGILNAPWKTNSDRQNLLEGPFNLALLDGIVDLAAESWSGLLDPEDPGRLLDLMTARAQDGKGWADEYLAKRLDERLAGMPSVPDLQGTLRNPSTLTLRPAIVLRDEPAKWVDEHRGRENSSYCHPSVEQRERRPRAARLGAREGNLSTWLVSVAAHATPEASIAAIELAGACLAHLPQNERYLVTNTAFILTEGGSLVTPMVQGLFLPPAGAAPPPEFVHHAVAADAHARAILAELRIQEPTLLTELQGLVRSIYTFTQAGWDHFWDLVHRLPREQALEVLRGIRASELKIRTRAGDYAAVLHVLLPGDVVPDDGSRDGAVAVDTVFHERSLPLLHSVGVVAGPSNGLDLSATRSFQEYLQGARAAYRSKLPTGSRRPSEAYLSFGSRPKSAWGPLEPLRLLSEEGKTRFVERCPDAAFADNWVMEHETQPGAYPRVPFHPPLHWVVSQHGLVRTSLGPRRLSMAVGRGLSEWCTLLPVADCDEAVAKRFGMAMTLEELSADQWKEAFLRAENSTDLALLGRFYARACLVVDAPTVIRCVAGTAWALLPPSRISVVHEESAQEVLREAAEPVLLVSDAKARTDLAERWGLQVTEVGLGFVAAAPETVFVDVLPGVGRFISPRESKARIQPCEALWLEFAGAHGAIRRDVQFARQGDVLFAMVDLPDADLLAHVLGALGRTLTDQERAAVLADAEVERTRADLERIRGKGGLGAKLLEAVGEGGLRRRLPSSVVAAVEPSGTPLPALKVAELALAVFGVDVLKQYAEELAVAGLRPPERWSASVQARAFVEDLGFPPEYAGFETPRLSPMLDVDGPVRLKPLHDFQEEIAQRISRAVTEDPPRRGLVALPTGAGKTRVAVEALIRAFRDREADGCLVWIAQSEELCEQAVQAWREAWMSLGPPRRLRLSRLWGQTNNRVVHAPGLTHVVVATFQSLASRIERPDYGWLRNAACVVVDEAHGSITPSYTRILEQFGLTPRETRRPLIGLTATPFRGAADVEETERLAARYHRHRFDHGVIEGDDPYPLLQRRGVLAMVQHKLLPGARFELTPQELGELQQFNRLPASAEQRIGELPGRNLAIVGSVLQHPSDWPILLFATSVDHASVLACLLSANGVSARAISAQTDRGARRHYIAEFKAGRLRALTNYGVLTTGFDAPAVRALYITRPVFSRVLYQQMIGRGLRGPLNGGKEQCLIVNVEDNFSQYGEQLAFRHFEYLWSGEATTASSS